MKVGLLITAAGPGRRLGMDMPKGLVEIGGVPLFIRTLRKFEGMDLLASSVVVTPPEEQDTFHDLAAHYFPQVPIQCIPGGAERQISVSMGLEAFELVVARLDLELTFDAIDFGDQIRAGRRVDHVFDDRVAIGFDERFDSGREVVVFDRDRIEILHGHAGILA